MKRMSVEQATVQISETPSALSGQTAENLILSLDAFVRSFGVQRSPLALFLGAGASTTSGIPSAEMCIWEWKRQIFLTNNPGLEDQFAELSLEGVRRKIQHWLDRQGGYPKEQASEEYGFYIKRCFPIASDRSAFFQRKVRDAQSHIGYRLLGHLGEADLIRTVWSTNFDGLPARAAAGRNLTVREVGIDSQSRISQVPSTGELLCVSLHGDYRYDDLKNTPEELQTQEAALRQVLVNDLRNTSLIVCGYSGRDHSVMDALDDAYAHDGAGVLYWCGFSDRDVPERVASLIRKARASGRQAFYVPSMGFDDLLTRLVLHCLQGERRKAANDCLEEFSSNDLVSREPFRVQKFRASTLIKSNAFAIECPAEVLQFDLQQWPPNGEVTSHIRERLAQRAAVALPFKGKVLALGTIDEIKEAFGDNIKGPIERTPITPSELQYDEGAIVSLLRQALVRSMADVAGLATDGRKEIWKLTPDKKVADDGKTYQVFSSVQIFLRRIGGIQYLVLKPSLKVLDIAGTEVAPEIANPIKLSILGWQHNKPFNQVVNNWRTLLFQKDQETTIFEFPHNCGSTFKFKIRRSPAFGEIGLPHGGSSVNVPAKLQPLLKYQGLQLSEPQLVFSNKAGTGPVKGPHPIRGIVENRPYDYPLTAHGMATTLRVGVICPASEAGALHAYLQKIHQRHSPGSTETDYLVDYPGFAAAYGLPIELPEPGHRGWVVCPEPSSGDPQAASLEVARLINQGVEKLQSIYAPHVVLIFYPSRWKTFQGYRNEVEHFDVHDFVKAYCVQRGTATQFLTQETLADGYQCRVWWWLSLALYVKGMRTPWVLDSLAQDTAFVGLGFSIDPNAERGQHVVLGCSHIYSARGEGLQYRLSKVENPIIRHGNPFMSKDDARRTGETIRQLFFDARFKLPDRVVLHKRTPFNKDEREGLAEGLRGVRTLDMIEIQIDNALRYVASVPGRDGAVDEDNYPVRRGTAMKLDDWTALVWVHGATTALDSRRKYFQGKRRIPAPLTVRRHAGKTDLQQIAEEILGLSKMNWNTFDLYTKFPATLQSSNEIARIGSLLQRFGASSYDYRLFI
ncbi:SIR2 family protein [Methylocapsa sp. D3K7]|uniref:argonaute/piwi family protein n=1 Tax=Methylocapsa sp. D3K7 TaxID=3041435 RepID=UPI00244ED285|nr:SIR2 family protein [Methylocapsa sp. D3K7]WGJ13888.1 SIR2 family protein [Methylocapsa sp. D3K7]